MPSDNDRTHNPTVGPPAGTAPPPVDLPMRLLTESEAAELLHLSPSTLKKWRRTCRGPRYHRLGSAVRYKVEDLDAFIRGAAVHPR